jgi:peptidoglycan/xylan/chitin deacetylase (PgdA/CDA1 family)
LTAAALAVGLLASGWPGEAAAADSGTGPTFGSQAVIDACWTPAELAGSPADRRTLRADPDPHRADPPLRHAPQTVLPPLGKEWREVVRRGGPPPGDKPIALTFDLCERERDRAGYDAAVVNYLRAHATRATFFAGGKWLRSHPTPAMQLIADPLFELGNHSWSHRSLTSLTRDRMEEQIQWAQAEYELLRESLAQSPCARQAGPGEINKIPRAPTLFRFPYGTCSGAALELAARLGLTAVQWDVVTGDPSPAATGRVIADYVARQARPGSIVIMHANGRGRHTAEALPLLVPELSRRGFRFVTVSELLRLGSPETAAECYVSRPGDARRYDRR